MKYIIEILNREVLLEVIKQAHTHWRMSEQTVKTQVNFKFELTGLAYEFLKKFNIRPEEVRMFREILTEQEINSLKDISSYNYYKISMTKK